MIARILSLSVRGRWFVAFLVLIHRRPVDPQIQR